MGRKHEANKSESMKIETEVNFAARGWIFIASLRHLMFMHAPALANAAQCFMVAGLKFLLSIVFDSLDLVFAGLDRKSWLERAKKSDPKDSITPLHSRKM